MRRLRGLAAGALLAIGASVAVGAEPSDADVAAAHAAAIVIDAHVDLPPEFATEKADPGVDGKSQLDLPKLERGGVDAASLAVFAWQQTRTPEQDAIAVATGQQKLAAIRRAVDWYPSRMALALTPDDVVRLEREGKRAAIVSVLNGTVLGAKAELLDQYYDSGLRQLGFTHASHNYLADSSRPLAKNGDAEVLWDGLSPLGRELVPRLNRLGVIIDVSQLSSKALEQVIALSAAPVIASHSGVRAMINEARNLSDDEIKRIARGGGVVHVVAFSAYLKRPPESYYAAVAELRARAGVPDDAALARLPDAQRNAFQGEFFGLMRSLPKASVADLVDQIEHVVKLVGVDHVGIGTDFEHGGGVVGFMNEAEAPSVTRELLRRGYDASDIAKIWGGNYLRVWREVERVSAAQARKAAA